MQVDNYIKMVFEMAQAIGSINSGSIEEATKWNPKRIVFSGITKDGEKFKLEMVIGGKADE
jgi:hypothetical protein